MTVLAFLAAISLVAAAPAELSPAGTGGFRIGMSLAETKAATDFPLVPHRGEDGACEEYRVGDDLGLYVMVESDQVTRVTVTDAGFRTPEGIEVGDTGAKVLAAYGDKAIRRPAPYAEDPAYELMVWTGEDRGIRFEIDDVGFVKTIHAGTRSIEYIEGCL